MLSVVVDDHLMGITHIIRGDDHLNNAFRQFHLYKNLNWKIPIFAHIPLMHGNDGKKLSKRHGSTDINEFKDNGYLVMCDTYEGKDYYNNPTPIKNNFRHDSSHFKTFDIKINSVYSDPQYVYNFSVFS